jgi:hypothetical protein
MAQISLGVIIKVRASGGLQLGSGVAGVASEAHAAVERAVATKLAIKD